METMKAPSSESAEGETSPSVMRPWTHGGVRCQASQGWALDHSLFRPFRSIAKLATQGNQCQVKGRGMNIE